jgi:hypothetical protein
LRLASYCARRSAASHPYPAPILHEPAPRREDLRERERDDDRLEDGDVLELRHCESATTSASMGRYSRRRDMMLSA